MKTNLKFILFITVILLGIITFFVSENYKPDFVLKKVVQLDTSLINFEEFQSLFNEDFKDNANKEIFNSLNSLYGEGRGSSHALYSIVNIDNQDVLLIRLDPEEPYEILEIKIVPKEINHFFIDVWPK